jgi:hypothetical protein
MTSNLCSARRSVAANRSGSVESRSRKGWYSSIVRPRSAQRTRTSPGESGDATRSGSNTSTPSKPAAAAATSLSSSVPDRQTVAIAVRSAPSGRFAGLRSADPGIGVLLCGGHVHFVNVLAS